jgi:hypothetical protein
MRFTLVGTILGKAIIGTYDKEHSPWSITPSCLRPPIQEPTIMDCSLVKPSLTHQHHDQVGDATKCSLLKDLIPNSNGQEKAYNK